MGARVRSFISFTIGQFQADQHEPAVTKFVSELRDTQPFSREVQDATQLGRRGCLRLLLQHHQVQGQHRAGLEALKPLRPEPGIAAAEFTDGRHLEPVRRHDGPSIHHILQLVRRLLELLLPIPDVDRRHAIAGLAQLAQATVVGFEFSQEWLSETDFDGDQHVEH